MDATYHHGDLRRAVLDRLVDVIVREGTAGVSLRSLAADLGVSHTAPRHHFGGREGLFTALATEGHQMLAEAMRAARDSGGGLLELGVAYVAFAREHPAHFEVMFEPGLLDLDDPALVAARGDTFGQLRAGVQALQADHRVADPSSAVLAAWAVVHGIAALALSGSLEASGLGDQADGDLLEITRRSARLLFPPEPRADRRRRAVKPAARFLTAFAVASVATLALSVALGHGWRPATDRPVVDPAAELPLPPARPREVSQHAVTVSSAPAEHDPVAAWIVRPTHSGPDLRAGAVLIAGAGAGGRDDLLSEARALAAANVVTVVYDKRTRGYHAWERDFAALADDALRAADRLRAEPGVDPARVGLLGWSEGGWVVAEAARRAPARIAFAGLMSAPVVSPADQLSWMARRSAPGTPRWLEKATATLLGAGRNPLPWTAYDSRPGLADLAVPVFGCWGADDPIVPVNEAVARVRDHVAGAVSLHVLPGAGHALPVESRYLERAARWLAAGAPTDPQTRGVEPASALGVGELPRPSWMTNPLLQLAVSAAVAAAVVAIRRRPRGRSTALPDDPEGAS